MFDKRLNQEATNQRKIFVFLVFLAIFSGIFAIGQAYLIATVVDQTFLGGGGLSEAWYLLWILMAVFLGRVLVNYLNNRLAIRMAAEIKLSLRRRMLDKIRSMPYLNLLGHKAGETNAVLTDAIDTIDDYYSLYLPQIIQALIVPVMILAVAFKFNLYSAIIMLVTAPLIPVFMYLIGSMADAKAQKQYDALMTFSGHFLDVFSGIATLKIFDASKRQKDNILTMTNNFRDSTMDVLKIAFLSALMLEILATISTAMIAVEVGLRLVYAQLTFPTAFFVLLLAPELYLPLKNLGASFHAGKNSIASANLIWEFLDDDMLDEDLVNDKLDYEIIFENNFTKEKLLVKDDHQNSTCVLDSKNNRNELKINVENISYSYPSNPERRIIDDISMEIKKGEHLAIIGRSGAGKSTLLSILLGILEPSQGDIRVDGTKLRDYKHGEWANRIAYLPQSPYIFAGTIYDNIAMAINCELPMDDEEIREKVIEAAVEAGVDLFVKDFPRGYETIIGEGGQGLSGGERQRLALTRVFVREADLVIFDEPTTGLDPITEAKLIESMSLLKLKSALVTVAHNLKAVMVADRILILDNGRIQLEGNHEDLIKQSQYYRDFVRLELGGASGE